MIDTLTKYDFQIPEDSLSQNITRLINQIWKLIPMKEKQEDWEKQLDTVILEIVGLREIFLNNPQFLQLLAKLEGLRELAEKTNFSLYRKTVFESIGLLRGLEL